MTGSAAVAKPVGANDHDLTGRLLRALDGQSPTVLLETLDAHLRVNVGTLGTSLWLVDYAEVTLERLTFVQGQRDSRPVDGEGYGQAFRTQRSVIESRENGATVFTPIMIRGERLGLLEAALAKDPTCFQINALESTAAALGHLLLAARRYTDVIELARRPQPLEVAAEMQWELLPLLAYEGREFSIAGKLEPAYDIGGDTFDYAIDSDSLQVCVYDAMGHGVRAALLSTLAVGVQRNARRQGLGLRQQVRAVDVAVHDQFGGEAFLTGMHLRIDAITGRARVVNAGHSMLFLARQDRVPAIVDLDADLPMGLFGDSAYDVQEIALQPDDRLLLVTDGVLEATPEEGEEFGVARLQELLEQERAAPPKEVVRLITRAVMRHRQGYLSDDASVVCIDWLGSREP